MLYLLSFLCGVLAVNGVPHFVKGICGEKHMTPFGRPSSAMINVAWGWLNLLVAALCAHFAHPHLHILRAASLFLLGALLVGVGLAHFWAEHPSYNGITPAKAR